MSRRQDFRGVGVERSVVDVQTEANEAAEGDVLSFGTDLGICEKECHSKQRTDNHGVFASEDFPVRHVPC